MGPQETVLSFRISHPSHDLSEVCRSLGLEPSRIWKKGDEWPERGRTNGRKPESSYCTITLGNRSRDPPLDKKIAAALELLKPHKAMLQRLSSSGGKFNFFVGWFLDDHTGESFDPQLMATIADLRIELQWDIYVPDTE